MPETDWARLKAHELRALADQNAVVILPVASTEQHGPHLPTMTDTRLGYEIAHRAARIAYDTRPVVVAPVVWSGLSEHHMPFGGTLTVSHATFRALIADLIDSITRLGFRDILISNSHGGNIVACQQILDELSPKVAATLAFVTYPTEAAQEYAEILEDQEQIMHAGEGETAMMMACEGDLVDASELGTIAQMGETGGPAFLKAGKSGYRWRPFAHMTANGLAGNPARATPEKGELLLQAGAKAVAALIADPDTWASPRDLRGAGTQGVNFRKE
ncbi:creatininase family protein [Lutimaribacter sp. EGI FJ00015]|uniref:Creatininase family protein n=1 Tax=Lutimaribacter degradans TaxID=2945989 RepID=A0ACC5ZQW8_9RHOB|nr:creatininase family protein [Lutimaribacter sp. EGI FJ00013]MCM2560563.1 creatininase family protein [Lutimaribacter sp. EGI FJ00013]MCO0612494.1 creatininase family protein [Lutimaribacter sp. EGI FJ00015]MCO0634387.1 creatininase family protein [Lutimaribacter sp. EGI FJ00014]